MRGTRNILAFLILAVPLAGCIYGGGYGHRHGGGYGGGYGGGDGGSYHHHNYGY
jgi:hypothetical protein